MKDKWLPIVSAPMDGTKIDLWVVETSPTGIESLRIPEGWWGKPDVEYGQPEKEPQWVFLGDRYGDDCVEEIEQDHTTKDGRRFIVHVTHWMPLPKPPEKETDNG